MTSQSPWFDFLWYVVPQIMAWLLTIVPILSVFHICMQRLILGRRPKVAETQPQS